MKKINSDKHKTLIETSLFIIFFISLFFSIISLSIMLIEKPNHYPFSLGNIDLDFIHLFIIYIICTPLGLKLFSLYYKMRNENDVPKLLEKNHILELKYSKEEWLKYKKNEYDIKIKKRQRKLFFIKAGTIVVMLIFYIMEPIVLFIMLHIGLTFFIPIQIVISKKILKEIHNNINEDNYSIKIYQNGLTINNWYYAYNYRYKRYTDYLKLIDIEIAEENDCKYLKFIRESQIFVLIPDGESGDLKGIGNVNIPLLEKHNINLMKLKKELNIFSS